MSCDLIDSGFAKLGVCVETTEGSRLLTQCLYPSFDPVHVYVVKVGDGFKVHDGGGAFRTAWLHGRDDQLIKRALDVECRRFHATRVEETITVNIDSADWLPSAILSVANSSSLAAHAAVARLVASNERQLIDRIEDTLLRQFGSSHVSREVEIRGRSGGKRRFDIVVNPHHENEILVNGVTAHHASISAKYVAFSDAEGAQSRKLAVHDKSLDADDVALLQQVALIMPLANLAASAHRAIDNIEIFS